ncbi:MAG: TonB-dependent receptor plug domain-containing protein [Bacteroidota bacterium]|nr:TonB-dependent receptor plug domain-containing protein [Bacteroidota bacterium]
MKSLFVFLFFCIAATAFSQQSVSGFVRDASTGEGLVGAIVVVDGGKAYAVADIDGSYKMSLADGTYKMKVKYTGYDADSFMVTVAGAPIVHDFNCNSATLKEVEIIADVAIDRKTPVAFSNISELKIREELGSRDVTMLLNSTPGAYATEQGGGAGDSRVNIRGVDQRNVGVMVDGVPMNDMENGQVYWSNWSGLSDVTRSMQVQRGLGASKLAIPSVGGTINMLTRGIDSRKSLVVRTDFGNNSMQKLSFMYNSGEIGKGWGLTFAGSRRTGNGWADQTWDDQWNYFVKVQKRFDRHMLSFSVNGAPQSHAQRFDRLPVGAYDKEFARKLIERDQTDSTRNVRGEGYNAYVDSLTNENMIRGGYTTQTQGPRGTRYNPNWGFVNYSDGQSGIISQNVNFYSKPLYNLSWSFIASDKLTITSVAYLSIGNGGGTNYNSSVPRDTLTGQQNLTSAYNSNSTTVDVIYSPNEHKSSRVLLASMNNHVWLGSITTATYSPRKEISFLAGVDARHYKGSHYRKVYDLIGGDYYVDASNENQPRGTYFGDPNFQYYKKKVNDKVTYWNESYVDWAGLFGQVEYSKDKWSAFVTGSYSFTQYQRVDHFRKRDIVIGDSVVPMIVGYNETYYTNGTESAVAQNGASVTTSGDSTIIDNPTGPNYYIRNAQGYRWDSENARTAETKKRTFNGFTVKTGVNYNLTSHYNVFVNVGYLKMAPRFNTVFDNANKEYPTIKYQIVKAIEMGIGARYANFACNVNMYYTDWENKPPSFSPTISTPDGTFFYDLLGLNTILKGVEFDCSWRPYKKIQVEALASFGDWKINSAGSVRLYDTYSYLYVKTINYSAENIHVGDAAQTQLGGAVRVEPIKGFYFKPRYTWFARNYSNFDPIALTQILDANGNVYSDNRNRDSWKAPAYGLLDIYAGYEIREVIPGGQSKDKAIIVSFNFSITNVLNTNYISDAQNGNNFDAASAFVYMGMGRRWNAGMRFSF